MSTTQDTTAKAQDRDGMTVADLWQFAQAVNNAHTPVDPRTRVKVKIGWRGQLLAITTGERVP